MKDEYQAPEGAVWVCAVCGKRAAHRVEGGISHMWDESCFLHAVLCDASGIELTPGGRVIAANAWEEKEKA